MQTNSKTKVPAQPDLVRINRYLSMCGISSRRKAEELVLGGKVKVNGRTVNDLATRIHPFKDKVFVDGKQVVRVEDNVYFVMNKPKDTITTVNDERGRTTVMSLVRSKQRVFPIGRLDRNTTGVLLFTNDGEFANRLMHPKHEIAKSYLVRCDEPVARKHLVELSKGVELEDGTTGPADVYSVPGSRGTEIGITIREGRNRQIHRMFEKLGYTVRKLDRVAYGPVTKEGIPRGRMRPLTHAEVKILKGIAGL